MTAQSIVQTAIDATPKTLSPQMRRVGVIFAVLGLVGLGLGFAAGEGRAAGWAALLTATAITAGLGMVGPLLSAIFEMTGAKWGRAYRRVAEAGVVLMVPGLVGAVALVAGGNDYLPWVHEHPHVGGKAVWLTRGFWDARLLGALIVSYGFGLYFVRLSVRRDFCLAEVKSRFTGGLAKWLAGKIDQPEAEAERLSRKLVVLAPLVAIVYGVLFSLIGFDLIMALEPNWFSTLFGAWYFIGNAFFGLGILAIFTIAFSKQLQLEQFFTGKRRADMATLMLAFCLINVDFFWNQYLTIWYANLPEETGYLIERTTDEALPWRSLSFVSLGTFFVIPFAALLLRKVKQSGQLLTLVATIALIGIFLARFIEIAPPLLNIEAGSGFGPLLVPIVSAALVLMGFLGVGLLLLGRVIGQVPIMAVADRIFVEEFGSRDGHE